MYSRVTATLRPFGDQLMSYVVSVSCRTSRSEAPPGLWCRGRMLAGRDKRRASEISKAARTSVDAVTSLTSRLLHSRPGVVGRLTDRPYAAGRAPAGASAPPCGTGSLV